MYKATLDHLQRSGQQSTDEFARIADLLADFSLKHRNFDQAIKYRERALAAQIAVHGRMSTNAALALRNLAAIYREKSQQAIATELNKQSLEIYEKLNGPESFEVGQQCLITGITCREDGKEKDALSYLERSLNIQNKLHGANSWEVAHDLVELAYTNLSFKNDLAAERCARQSLKIQANFPPAERYLWGNSWVMLAQSLSNQGKFQEAYLAGEKGLSYLREQASREKDTAPLVYALSCLLQIDRQSGNFIKAKNHAKERLELVKEKYGQGFETGQAWFDLGDSAARAADEQLAVLSLTNAEVIFESSGNPDRAKVARDLLIRVSKPRK